jgi:hypothetical protein
VAMQHGGDAAANVTAVEQMIDRVSEESSAKGTLDSSPDQFNLHGNCSLCELFDHTAHAHAHAHTRTRTHANNTVGTRAHGHSSR